MYDNSALLFKCCNLNERVTLFKKAKKSTNDKALIYSFKKDLQAYNSFKNNSDSKLLEILTDFYNLSEKELLNSINTYYNDTKFPKHIKLINEFLKSSQLVDLKEKCIIAGYPKPFEEIIIRFVTIARIELLTKFNKAPNSYTCAPSISILNKHAYLKLEYVIFKDIFQLIEKHLYKEYKAFKKNHKEDTYNQFIIHFLKPDNLYSFFYKYPTLTRSLSIKINEWVNTTTEMLNRFEKDMYSINTLVKTGVELVTITNIIGPLGDTHLQGHRVYILELNNKYKIVYKPRSIKIYSQINKIIDVVGKYTNVNLIQYLAS